VPAGGKIDIDAVKVVIPPDGRDPRQITNQLCPSQLPSASVSTTYTNDTLTCSGGTLAIGEQFAQRSDVATATADKRRRTPR
jgi:hypothetical protein